MLSNCENRIYTPDLDFSIEANDWILLRDYEGVIPPNEPEAPAMEAIKREEWLPVVIRLLFCARGKRVTSTFCAELIQLEAITFSSLQSFLTALEATPTTINLAEIELFTDIYQRLRSAHSVAQNIEPQNITNAFIGYASDIKVSREKYIAAWLKEVRDKIYDEDLMTQDLADKFNTFTLDKILSLTPQST